MFKIYLKLSILTVISFKQSVSSNTHKFFAAVKEIFALVVSLIFDQKFASAVFYLTILPHCFIKFDIESVLVCIICQKSVFFRYDCWKVRECIWVKSSIHCPNYLDLSQGSLEKKLSHSLKLFDNFLFENSYRLADVLGRRQPLLSDSRRRSCTHWSWGPCRNLHRGCRSWCCFERCRTCTPKRHKFGWLEYSFFMMLPVRFWLTYCMMGAARDALTERPGGELLQGSFSEVTLAFDVHHALPLLATENEEKFRLTRDFDLSPLLGQSQVGLENQG